MNSVRNHILQNYGVAPDARLSSGMEAEVYAYGPETVLKLYPETVSLADLSSLRGFYDGLEREHLPYALPRIHTIAQDAGYSSASSSGWEVRHCLSYCLGSHLSSLMW